MQLLFNQNPTLGKLLDLIQDNARGDYIYMYPPRQAYNLLDSNTAYMLALESIDKFSDLNLYFHVPFCKQICSFCNLYTKVSTNQQEHKEYVELMISELKFYEQKIRGKKINTLYIGGGTPSLLDPKDLSALFTYLSEELGINIYSIPEVALEVAPDTVTMEKLSEFKAIGINRVNLGFQSTNSFELSNIGRKHGAVTLTESFNIIKEIGFLNVCIDLIYGLQNQSMESWKRSLETVIEYYPETICIYPLTLRPATIYNKKGYLSIDANTQYEKYDFAVNALSQAGYSQETHVRYVRDNGGYLQKEKHWQMENVLGIGAGARSYLWLCDTRNNYGAVKRDKAYRYYVDCIKNGKIPITDGFIMTEKEKMAKAVILNLICLNRDWFKNIFNLDVLDAFPQLTGLEKLNLIKIDRSKVYFTANGLKYRDLIVQLFFTQEVSNKIKAYHYED